MPHRGISVGQRFSLIFFNEPTIIVGKKKRGTIHDWKSTLRPSCNYLGNCNWGKTFVWESTSLNYFHYLVVKFAQTLTCPDSSIITNEIEFRATTKANTSCLFNNAPVLDCSIGNAISARKILDNPWKNLSRTSSRA